ncbi:MAG: polysaccharide deacetylase family protein [Thermomicrobium sp.]|nr:polysaccharide deacetylase family protein [Thermomicrobium sp.]MDW8060180.1 polysaccharide deacetylase family protein [Thermomicrobium sp.]
MRRQVLVSVHDVAPAWTAEIRWLLRELDAVGARPRSLLVIPYHDGRDDLRRFPALVELLAEEVANGSELVLHGYTHARAGRWRGDPLTVARAALFARGVAEFASLAWPEQRARLLAGRELLAQLGFRTTGFCPPGWLHTAELPGLLAELGFAYLVEMLFLVDVRDGRRLATPWTGYMGTPWVHEALAQLGARLLAPVRAVAPRISVFFHPQGAPSSAVCRRVLRELAAELERGGEPATYATAIASP